MPPTSRFQSGRIVRTASTRRQFLQLSTAALSGALLSNCAGNIGSTPAGSPASPAATGGASPAARTLNIYTWANYVDDELIQGFENKTGIRVVADVFDSNETMLAKMQAGGGSAYSLIYPSDYMVAQMLEETDLLQPIDRAQVQHLDGLLANWKNPPYDPNNQHSIPYVWGTTGILYNAEAVNPAPTDWDTFWANRDPLRRRMTMLNDVREVFGVALKSLGYSTNTTNPDEIREAYEKLRELKGSLNQFTTDGWRDQMVAGDLALAQVYSTDGIGAKNDNANLRYIVPASGTTLWTDTIAMPRTAPNVQGAYAWINYLLEPQNASKLIDRLNLAVPYQGAIDLASDEKKSNRALFPDAATLAKCEAISPVGDAIDIYDRYWTQLTSG